MSHGYTEWGSRQGSGGPGDFQQRLRSDDRRGPYEVLGVPRDATRARIRSAYRRLALRHHPDRVRGDADAKARANERFAEIGAAYELLTRGSDEATAPFASSSSAPSPPPPTRAHAADAAAGGPTWAPQQPPPPYFDPFSAFGGWIGLDGRSGAAFGPFEGFVFSDPFELFREAFTDDLYGHGHGGGGVDPTQDEGHVPEAGGGGGAFGLIPPPFASAAAAAGGPPFAAAVGGGGDYSSYSFSSSGAGGAGADGTVRTVSTTTSVIGGRKIVKSETTVISPDGSRETTINVTGDEDVVRAEPDMLEDQRADDILENMRRMPMPGYGPPNPLVCEGDWSGAHNRVRGAEGGGTPGRGGIGTVTNDTREGTLKNPNVDLIDLTEDPDENQVESEKVRYQSDSLYARGSLGTERNVITPGENTCDGFGLDVESERANPSSTSLKRGAASSPNDHERNQKRKLCHLKRGSDRKERDEGSEN